MSPALVLAVALAGPAAPLPRDTAPNTSGPAPRVLALKADAGGVVRVIGAVPVKVTVTNTQVSIETVVVDGKQVQQQVQKQVQQDIVTAQYVNKTLGEFNGTFTTAAGAPLTLEEATNRMKNGATVLASADGKPVAKAWLRAASDDTVVLVAEGLSHLQPQVGSGVLPTTPAPRLAMLGTDATGKVLTACTSHPLSASGASPDDTLMEGRVLRGRGIRVGASYGDYNPQQLNAKVVVKPLADVHFEAYDLTGKLVPRGEALKRLAAGGMVLVAGDGRAPDETYLKGFREDVLVLAGSELVLPVAPIDQTKKKEVAPAPAAVLAPGGADQPVPVPRAGIKQNILIKGRATGGAVPAVEEPAQVEKK